MKLIHPSLLAVLSLVLFVSASSASTSQPLRISPAGPESLTIEQSQPVWGEQLTLTATFSASEKKDWPPRIYNPTVAVQCGSYREATFWSSGKHDDNLGGGWWTSTYSVVPQGSGPATCTAWLEFTDSAGNTSLLASAQFSIVDKPSG